MKKKGLTTQASIDTYKKLCKKIQRECRQDKNNYIKKICAEIEEHQNSNETHDLYKKVRELTRKFNPKTSSIEDKNGKILWENKEILDRWKQFIIVKNYTKMTQQQETQVPDMTGEQEPHILKSEVEEAITHLKANKASGVDEVSAEMIKLLGDEGTRIIHDICNKVWQTGQWPRDWTKSAFVPIHKKG